MLPQKEIKPEGYRRKTQKQSRYAVVRELRATRERRGIDRVQLAEELGYHHMMIGRWERGEATPSLQRLQDWADALGVQIGIF